MPTLTIPLVGSKFTLDWVSVAGLFGGQGATSAMATVHLYKGRRWLGWYNSPGSYTMAKRFGRMVNSRFWDGLFPGSNKSPEVSFGLDGKIGPQYVAAFSQRTMATHHLGYLTMERSKELEAIEIKGSREITPVYVSYLVMKPVNYGAPIEPLHFRGAIWGLIPIAVSVSTCVMCALVYDWFSFSVILVGIVSSGMASFVIGEGRIVIELMKKPSVVDSGHLGHGILFGEESEDVMVIKGMGRDVNAITNGHFVLETRSQRGDLEKGDVSKKHAVGVCSLLLLFQSLLQLFLAPQGSLFGQIMFLISLGVSWGYNSYLSSLEKEKIQAAILFKALGNPEMRRFRTSTTTTRAVFLCLLLFHGVECWSPEEDRAHRLEILRSCIRNNTTVWRRWRHKVVEQLLNMDEGSDVFPHLEETEDDRALSEAERALLRVLLDDAGAAFRGYLKVRKSLVFADSANYDEPSEDGVIYFRLEEM